MGRSSILSYMEDYCYPDSHRDYEVSNKPKLRGIVENLNLPPDLIFILESNEILVICALCKLTFEGFKVKYLFSSIHKSRFKRDIYLS